MLSVAVEADNLPEGIYGEALREIAEARPQVSIGSYPSYRDGKFHNQIVVRCKDPAMLEEAKAAVEGMVAKMRGDGEPASSRRTAGGLLKGRDSFQPRGDMASNQSVSGVLGAVPSRRPRARLAAGGFGAVQGAPSRSRAAAWCLRRSSPANWICG